jgi:hypothetical protein
MISSQRDFPADSTSYRKDKPQMTFGFHQAKLLITAPASSGEEMTGHE